MDKIKTKCLGCPYQLECHGYMSPTDNAPNGSASQTGAQAACIGFRFHEAETAFQRSRSLEDCIRAAEMGSMLHTQYQHYTTFARALQIFKHRRLWLTRGDSESLNDQIEWQKYGPSKKIWKNLFQASFSYGTAEHAFMWYVYCRTHDNRAVRITFSRDAMILWKAELQKVVNDGVQIRSWKKPDEQDSPAKALGVDRADIQDILYLAVDDRDRYSRKRNNTVAWGTQVIHFETLPDDIRSPNVAGWIKDYEWRAEHETRIRIMTKPTTKTVKSISIPIPFEVLRKASLTFGPWTTDDEAKDMIRQFRTAISTDQPKLSLSSRFFKYSFLFGAVENWRNNS